MFGFRLDSDAPYPYGNLAPRKISAFYNVQKLKEIVAEKKETIAWFSSNCKTPSNRKIYATELSKHIKIDHYGRCGNLECSRNTPSDETKCWDMVEKNYYFYLSFENSICKDYVTEKFWKPSQKFVVPIVLKRSIVEAVGVPSSSFIAIDDFPNAKALADHLKFLIENPAEYMKHFEWKIRYKINWANSRMRNCELCRIIAEGKTRMIPNINAWWHTDAKCESL